MLNVIAGRIESEGSKAHRDLCDACFPFLAMLPLRSFRDVYHVRTSFGLVAHMFPESFDILFCISGMTVDSPIRVGANENGSTDILAALEKVV